MANITASKKAARQTLKHREHNVSLLSRFRSSVKSVVNALDRNDAAGAKDAYRRALPIIDATADKRLIHRNKAARHKSRLNARLRAMASS